MTRFATTTDTGDPITVPYIDLPVNLALESQTGGFQAKFEKGADSTERLVLSGREGSLVSRSRDTWIARAVGTRVNRDTTSKDTKTSGLGTFWVVINWANCREFFTWESVRPTMGDSREARNLERAYVGEDTKDTIGRRGTSSLWTLATPKLAAC